MDTDVMDIEALRAETPGCAERTHLNNAGAGLVTRRTLRATTDHLELEARIGGYEAAAEAADAIEDVYAGMARLLGGRREEVALFDNSTHAWNAAFYSVPLGPGDRIVTGRDEYGSSVLAYLQVARRTGAELVVVPNDADGQIDLAALAGAVDERTLVGLTYVPTYGGLVNPAAEVGRIARAAGALYLLDGTQAVGQFPVDVAELGCDLLTGTGRKFLRGPRGTGFLWVRADAVDRLDPYVVEIGSATWDGGRGFDWQPGAHRFETWERSGAVLLGLGVAVEQALELGMDAIGERAVGLGAARPAGGAADRDHPRPGPPPVRDRHRGRRRRAARAGRGGAGGGRDQRDADRAAGQPAGHRGPGRPPAGPHVAALLQHRGRAGPLRRGAGRPLSGSVPDDVQGLDLGQVLLAGAHPDRDRGPGLLHGEAGGRVPGLHLRHQVDQPAPVGGQPDQQHPGLPVHEVAPVEQRPEPGRDVVPELVHKTTTYVLPGAARARTRRSPREPDARRATGVHPSFTTAGN